MDTKSNILATMSTLCGGVAQDDGVIFSREEVTKIMDNIFAMAGQLGYVISATPSEDGSNVELTVDEIGVNEASGAVVGKVKSDGGSSSYYQLNIVNRKTGETFSCEMGDVIASVYDNDFDMGNVAKAMRRIAQDRKGLGKEGNDSLYDANKCVYFSEMLVQSAKLGD